MTPAVVSAAALSAKPRLPRLGWIEPVSLALSLMNRHTCGSLGALRGVHILVSLSPLLAAMAVGGSAPGLLPRAFACCV